jgi:NAD-dependent DNA ligase
MVVLTDHPGVGRLHLIEHAERLGLAVRTEVTSATTLVVVGDVTSSSRRARLARELGVPIATTKQLLATNPGGEISAEVQPPKKS